MNDGFDLLFGKIGANGIDVIAFVGKEGVRGAFGQVNQGIIRPAICCLAAR